MGSYVPNTSRRVLGIYGFFFRGEEASAPRMSLWSGLVPVGLVPVGPVLVGLVLVGLVLVGPVPVGPANSRYFSLIPAR